MGRTAAGVMAIRLHSADDEVVGFDVVKPHAELLVVHVHGYGKRTPLAEYTAHSRYTQGNWATDHTRLEEVGPIVAARVVEPNDQITVMTANGIVLRTKVDGIRTAGRMTRGVRVVNLGEGDTVAAVAVMTHADLNRGVDDGGETGVDLALNGGDAGNGNNGEGQRRPRGLAHPKFEEIRRSPNLKADICPGRLWKGALLPTTSPLPTAQTIPPMPTTFPVYKNLAINGPTSPTASRRQSPRRWSRLPTVTAAGWC
jgi:hypothetical protein